MARPSSSLKDACAIERMIYGCGSLIVSGKVYPPG